MSEYEKIQKKVKINIDFSRFTEYPQEEYLPIVHPGFATTAIHAGQEPESVHGSVNVPIHLSSTFAQNGPGDLKSNFDYTRCGNPTREAFETAISAVEYGKHTIAYSAGVAAITAIFHQLVPGDHVICCDDVYGGTQRYLRNFSMKQYQIEVDFIDTTIKENVQKTLKKNTKLVWIETPTNPTLKISDIKGIIEIVKNFDKNIIVAVDNTFLSPYLQSPLLLGADVVMHSVSKYIGGHSDLIMGTTTTNSKELNDKLFFAAKTFGGNPSPFDCYNALKGLKTLEVRTKVHCYNAYCLAHFLEQHPAVEKVYYSGLKSNPQHELAKKQQRGFGGMCSFQIKGDLREGKRFFEKLKVFTLAESLGGVESLAELPAIMTHASVPKEQRDKLGITGSLVRLSVGIEDINDILEDVDNALKYAVSQ